MINILNKKRNLQSADVRILTPSLKARWVTWSIFLSSATVAGGLTYYETRSFPVKKM